MRWEEPKRGVSEGARRDLKKKKKTKVKEETREFTIGKTKGVKENIVSRTKRR